MPTPAPARLGAALAPALLLAGCSLFGGEASYPATVEVAVQASDRLNPDESGQSLPTVIRLYLLKSPAKLEAADFDDLYRRAKELLGEDLVSVEELVLSPGDKVTRRLAPEKAARALAAVAIFRRPVGGNWRAVVELPKETSVRLAFYFDGYRVEGR
jgi:type VI secretion system protein VasD